MDNTARILDRKVTVCSVCECASCWLGIFMCDYADMAGTKDLTVRDLHERPRGENAEYWFKSGVTGAIDHHALAEYNAATGGQRFAS